MPCSEAQEGSNNEVGEPGVESILMRSALRWHGKAQGDRESDARAALVRSFIPDRAWTFQADR